MSRLMLFCAWLCAIAFVVAANPAQAGNFVSYVSNTGADGNDCSNPTTEACATFAHALTETYHYGEIDCVNAGNYAYSAALTITQSVTIDCAGGVGSLAAASTITVNGGGIVVRLRNLTVDSNGYPDHAIDAQNMAALYIENCVITNYNSANGVGAELGIKFEPLANAQLFVSNTIISDNGSSSTSLSGGIYIVPGSNVTAEVSIDHSQINGNYFGIVGDGRQGGIIKATISDSVVSGNTENGITAISSGSSVVFIADQTKITNNAAAGLFAGGSNTGILASSSTISGNAVGLDTADGGALYTYGNNRVNGNTTNGAFTGTVGLQ
jgi:hypothetical protein